MCWCKELWNPFELISVYHKTNEINYFRQNIICEKVKSDSRVPNLLTFPKHEYL